MKLTRVDFIGDAQPPERRAEEREAGPALWLQLVLSLSRALVLLFLPLIALGLGVLVGRRFDSAWAMLGSIAVLFVAGGILVPGEPL